MIEIDLEDIAYLIAGKRPRLEVGYLPHEVAKFFGTSKATVLLSTESARHILDEHGDHIGPKELTMLPTMLQHGGWMNDRDNHCAVIFYSKAHDWHFHAVVKATKDRQETLIVSLRMSRRKSVKRTVKRSKPLRDHW